MYLGNVHRCLSPMFYFWANVVPIHFQRRIRRGFSFGFNFITQYIFMIIVSGFLYSSSFILLIIIKVVNIVKHSVRHLVRNISKYVLVILMTTYTFHILFWFTWWFIAGKAVWHIIKSHSILDIMRLISCLEAINSKFDLQNMINNSH